MPSFDTPEQAAALLDTHPDYRVQRVLPHPSTLALPTPHGRVRTALIIDTETTSLVIASGKIIQIACCRVSFDNRGRVVEIEDTLSWLEDPGEPLTPEITRLTRLTDAELAGHRIDDTAVEELIREASVIIAHNAAFDRPWWEQRFPSARAKAWACTLREVGWRAHGYEGRTLGGLLGEVGGWFNARHRADADVDALVALLTAELPNGRTVASELLLTAVRPKVRIGARRAPYAVKDQLRLRGYRWSAACRTWQTEIAEEQLELELAWLAAEAECTEPSIERVTWFDRHR